MTWKVVVLFIKIYCLFTVLVAVAFVAAWVPYNYGEISFCYG